MGRRKGRRTRSDYEGRPSYDRLDGWELIYGPYTVEGRIEGIARFSRGLRQARGRKRRIGFVVWTLMVAPFVLSLIAWIVHVIVV